MYFEGIFLTIVCVSALIGNICMWIIICKANDLRTVTNAFILGLTTADLLVAAGNMPITILTIFFGEWSLSDSGCIVFGYSNMLTLVLSVMSLCNISINRYIMVCKPFYFKTIYTKRNAVIMICSCVSVSIVLSLPPLVGWAEYSYISEQHFCFCNWAKAPSYAFFMIGCCFGIPFTVMSICNILIFRTVRASKSRVAAAKSKISTNSHDRGSLKSTIVTQATSILPEPSTVSSSQTDKTLLYIANRSPNNRTAVTLENLSAIDDVKVDVSTVNSNLNRLSVIKSKQQQKILRHATDKARSDEIRLALALAIVVIMFVVCWLPFCISMLIGIFSPNAASDKFHMWTLLIGYSNSCMNPVIYGALNKKFGEGFKDIFCQFCKG